MISVLARSAAVAAALLALAGCAAGPAKDHPVNGTGMGSPTTSSASVAPGAEGACRPTGLNRTRLVVADTSMDHDAGNASKGVHGPTTIASSQRLNFSVVLGRQEYGGYRDIRVGAEGAQLGRDENGSSLFEFHASWTTNDVATEKPTNTRLNVSIEDQFMPGDYRLIICLEERYPVSDQTRAVAYFNRTVRFT